MQLTEAFLARLAATRKVNPQSALSLMNDASRNALVNILIKKGVFTAKEYDSQVNFEFDQIAGNIEKMPPLPRA